MNRVSIETADGSTLEYYHYDGIFYPKSRVEKLPSKDMAQHAEMVRNLEIRDDDIYLATYEKSGTHWVWEILMMLKKGSVEYDKNPKELVFLDFRSAEHLANVPSPRILNAHFRVKHLPEGIIGKGNKIVHVQRNPKDISVSLYHHLRNFGGQTFDSFSKFLPIMLGQYGFYHYYPWFKYVKEWERFSQEKPEQVLNVYFEDLKEDPVREIQKMNVFLGCNRDEELIKQIAEACTFQNLKKANDDVKDFTAISGKAKGGQLMYRKGEVGDWKNWFTVAENEKMDAWLKENLVDTDLKFRYEL